MRAHRKRSLLKPYCRAHLHTPGLCNVPRESRFHRGRRDSAHQPYVRPLCIAAQHRDTQEDIAGACRKAHQHNTEGSQGQGQGRQRMADQDRQPVLRAQERKGQQEQDSHTPVGQPGQGHQVRLLRCGPAVQGLKVQGGMEGHGVPYKREAQGREADDTVHPPRP